MPRYMCAVFLAQHFGGVLRGKNREQCQIIETPITCFSTNRGFWFFRSFFYFPVRGFVSLNFSPSIRIHNNTTLLYTRPAQFFLGFPPPTPRWSLGQNLPGDQFSANSEVVWPRHRGSEGPQVEVVWALPGDLRSLRGQTTLELAENWSPGRF